MMREEDEDNEPKRPNEVAEPDDAPVAQHRPGGNLAAGPGHHDQIVAREKLGSADKDESQAEGENNSADDAYGGEAERGITGYDGIVERAEADATAGHDCQHERGQK